jgi:hypothetical protein
MSTRCSGCLRTLAAVAGILLASGSVFAQSGTIAGTVKDATGALLPGVTVEAASPALIEKVRTALTDGQGEYKIVDLRPGTYDVTFTLTGFASVKREGIELTSGTTANVGADLRVGGVEETVTVSGQSPLIDVQTANQYRAITRTELDNVPTSRNWWGYVVMVPGVSASTRGQDVGGSIVDQSQALAIHGSVGQDMPHWFDGMRSGNMFGTGGGTNGPYPVNNAMVQEIAVDTSGPSAEVEVSGIRSNIIPKQGGNDFSGYFFVNGTNKRFLANNLDDDLRARGAPTPTVLKKVWDVNPGLGGPIARDRAWFYAAYRYSGSVEQPPGAFYDVDPYDLVFTPDTERGAATNPGWTHSTNGRLTFQLTQKHKLTFYADKHARCIPCAIGVNSATAWESSTKLTTPTNSIFQLGWNAVLSSRLFIEAGETYKPDSWGFYRQDGVRNNLSAIVDSGRGITFRAPTTAETQQTSRQHNGRFTLSFVTGSHHLKVGTQWFSGWRRRDFQTPNDSFYTFVNGTPSSVSVRATPFSAWETMKLNFGAFIQEQWTVRRLTMNVGLRYDHINMYIPEQHLGPVAYVGARDFAEIPDIPNYSDLSPRVGLAYDLFGNGRTALKGSVSRYIEGIAGGFPENVNPITQNATAARAWTDSNNNFIPDCNLANQAQNGECQPSNNQNFGKPVVPFRYDPGTVTGWGNRAFNWEGSVAVQQQVGSSMAVEVSYFRRWFGNFRLTKNTLLSPSDYDTYCITAPVDGRLALSGQSICGFYDLKPTVTFGINDSLVTSTESFGDVSQQFDGVDLTVNLRLPAKVQIQGGTSTGRTSLDFCSMVRPDVSFGGSYAQPVNPYGGSTLIPNDPAYCDLNRPFQTQAKFMVISQLPFWGLQASATIQSLPGPEVQAIWAASAFGATSVVTGLNRALSGGVRTISVPLIPAGTTYGERMNQIDFRLAKNLRWSGLRIQPQLDLYNLFNANAVYGQINTYGISWLRPTQILLGRMLKGGIQIDF